MSRILVTGAGGFIGRPCLPRLRDAGFEVWATSRSAGAPIEGVHWIAADLLAQDEAERLLGDVRPSHLLHLAWYVVPGKFWTAEENRDWLAASRRLVDAAAAAGVQRVVIAGTGFEYDFSGGYCDETTTPLAPTTPYARAKAELWEAIAGTPGMNIAWARIFWQYGPHEDPARLAPSIIRPLLEDRPAVCRTPELRRPFLHVDDVAGGLAALCASDITGPVNIVADEPVRIGDFVETAARLVGRPDLVRFEPSETSDAPSVAGSNARLRSTGWRPRHDLTSGLADTIAWWKQALGGERVKDGALEALRALRIGYAPISADFSAPGDRRRFVYWAAQRGVSFEVADPGEAYDLVILTERADFSAWRRYTRGRMIFDLVDSYLLPHGSALTDRLRAPAKFVARQWKHFEPDFRTTVAQLCSASAAVACSTPEQAAAIAPYNDNVHVILDIMADDVRTVKTDYSAGSTLNLVWEGLPYNLPHFAEIAPLLAELIAAKHVALHVITDLTYPAALGRFGRRSTEALLKRLGLKAGLYAWQPATMAAIATSCDLAIIPLPSDDAFARAKPENKLLFFWRMGLPVLATDTRAYERVMALAGLDMTCRTPGDWRGALERYGASETLRREGGQKGLAATAAYFSPEATLDRWDTLLGSVLGDKALGQRSAG